MRKSIRDFQREVFEAVRRREYVELPPVIFESYISTVKMRFRVKGIREGFLQFYYNEDNGKTSMAFIIGDKRVYGHDYTPKMGWHRHLPPDGLHDYSEEGKKSKSIGEFLGKVDDIVKNF